MSEEQKLSLYKKVSTRNPDLFRYMDQKGDWNYYYSESNDAFIPAVGYILKTAYNKGPWFNQWLLTKTKEEAKEILEGKGNRGSRVHDAINMIINGHEITQETVFKDRITGYQEHLTWDEWKFLLSFKNFCEVYKPKTINDEMSVCDEKLQFAGTYDWKVSILLPLKKGQKKRKRVQALIDFKTSTMIYDSHHLQNSAYWGTQKQAGLYTGILRLGTRHKSGFEFQLRTPKEARSDFKLFKALLPLHAHAVKNGAPKNEIIDTVLSIDIPRLEIKDKKNVQIKNKNNNQEL